MDGGRSMNVRHAGRGIKGPEALDKPGSEM